MNETGLAITTETRQDCAPLSQLHLCSSLTINWSFAKQFQSTKEQKTQSAKKAWVISLPVSSLDWVPKESGTGLEHSQEHNHSLLLLICPGCGCWTSVPHDTPLNPLQEDHSHFPHCSISFPKLHPDPTEREIGKMPNEGDCEYITGPEVQHVLKEACSDSAVTVLTAMELPGRNVKWQIFGTPIWHGNQQCILNQDSSPCPGRSRQGGSAWCFIWGIVCPGEYYSPLLFYREAPKTSQVHNSCSSDTDGCWSKAPSWTACKEIKGGTALGLPWVCTGCAVGHVLFLSWKDFRNHKNKVFCFIAKNDTVVKAFLEGNVWYLGYLVLRALYLSP